MTTVHREQAEGYQTLIRLAVETERGERTVAGTLFHEQRPRVVEVNGIETEAQLGPHMLYVRNEDKPGIIGALGKTLGDAGVNIATFHLGRARPGGEAIALIEVDQPVSEGLLHGDLRAAARHPVQGAEVLRAARRARAGLTAVGISC